MTLRRGGCTCWRKPKLGLVGVDLLDDGVRSADLVFLCFVCFWRE